MFDDLGGWFKDHLGDIGDIAGIVSAVAGALAFIPVLTPIAGPVALIAGGVALAAHGADMVVNEKWDDINAWGSLAGDAIGLIPGVKAVGAGFNAAGDVVAGSERIVDVTRATGVTGMLNTGVEAVEAGARGTAHHMSTEIAGMVKPSVAAQWVADRALGVGALADPNLAANVAKGLEGGTNVALQIPSAIGLADTSDQATNAKNVTGGTGTVLGGITAIIDGKTK
jgi:hypothetical protein